jgi:hypothetical protein
VQNALGSDIRGQYRNKKCRFPLTIHHLCFTNYGRQKITIVITKYENAQLMATEVGDFPFIDTACQQSKGNYTPELSKQAIYNKSIQLFKCMAMESTENKTAHNKSRKYRKIRYIK